MARYSYSQEISSKALEQLPELLDVAKQSIQHAAKHHNSYTGAIEFNTHKFIRSYEKRRKYLFWRKETIPYEVTLLMGVWEQ